MGTKNNALARMSIPWIFCFGFTFFLYESENRFRSILMQMPEGNNWTEKEMKNMSNESKILEKFISVFHLFMNPREKVPNFFLRWCINFSCLLLSYAIMYFSFISNALYFKRFLRRSICSSCSVVHEWNDRQEHQVCNLSICVQIQKARPFHTVI